MAADLVTLSWCLGEIREALAQTERLLERQLASEEDDLGPLRSARAALHQAHGALLVVGIEGVPLITEEAERLLDAAERGEVAVNGRLASRLSRAFQALVEHLETLLRQEPHQPLYLFPYYRSLLEARRADRVHPADLFFPDLAAVHPPQPAGGWRHADAASLAAARAGFERGLLQLMRGADPAAGAAAMRAAIDAVGISQVGSVNRTFWWVAQAWFDALADGALVVDLPLKRLLGRLNLQLRKAVEEGAPVASQLTREMLFALAGVTPSSPRVAGVHAAFGLARAVPAGYDQPRYGRMDARMLRAARESIVRARTAFDKVTRGSAGELAAFSQAIDAFCDAVLQMPAEGLRALGRALAEVRARLGEAQTLPGEALSLELATAILFAEQAVEDGARPDSDHDRHGHEMAARLSSAFAGDAPPPGEMPEWLRSLSRAAQDRLTMVAFVAETGNNLRSAEKSLDAFFRDTAQRDELPACVRSLHQVGGALRLLGHDDAACAAESVAGRVAALADADPAAVDTTGFDRIASTVGALGFFVEGLQGPERLAGRFEYDAATGDFHAHLAQPALAQPTAAAGDGGDAATDATALPVHAAGGTDAGTHTSPSVESALADNAGEAAKLFDALRERPGDQLLRGALRDTVARVREAAVLLDRAERRDGADQALALLAGDAAPDAGALARALESAGVALRQAPTPSAPMPADEAAIDSELLGIFLGEAEEVLGAIEEHSALSLAAPSDVGYLTTIRRGFHTLKGSSRMVGLTAFGEAGWALEQVMNQWLAEERPGEDRLYALIDEAVARMRDWVRGLHEDPASGAAIDPAALVAHAEAVRDGRATGVDVDARAVASEAPVEAVAGAVEGIEGIEGIGEVEEMELAELPVGLVDVPTVSMADAVELAAHEIGAQAAGDRVPEMSPAAPAGLAALPGSQEDAEVDADATVEADATVGAGATVDIDPALDADAAVDGAAAPDVVRIGAREISAPLYQIFLSEADDLLARLVDDVREWRAQPTRGASTQAMRAAHSLKGSSAIVQLDGVREIAERLEAFMQAQRACAEAPQPDELSVLADVVERMQAMLHRFAAGNEPGDEPQARAAIAALAATWRAKRPAGRPVPQEDAACEEAGVAHEDAVDVHEEAVEPARAFVPAPALELAPSAVPETVPSAQVAAVRGDEASAAPLPPDELDPDLLPIFVEEAEDDLPLIGENLRSWQARPADASLPQTLMRQLHTVKGSARMAGAMALGQLVHEIENRVEAIAGLADVPAALVEELVAEHDRVVALFEALKRGPAPAAVPVPGVPQAVAAGAGRPLATQLPQPGGEPAAAGSTDRQPAPVAEREPAEVSAAEGPARPSPAADAPAQRSQPLVRVRADILDRMVNEAGEASIARSRLDNGLTGLRQSLADLTENVARLRSQLREIEIQAETQIQARIAQRRDDERDFDPLEFDRFTRFQELTRMLAESVNDVATVQHNAMRTLEESSQDLHRQGQVLRDLQQDLMRVRMLQFGSIGDRLYRVVRQAAKALDKRVRLDIRGSEVEIDRSVLERMAGPIEHLLRNAVAHGIEPRQRRAQAGKPETGEILVEVRQEGREIVLSFADDGGGLDADRIRARALESGLVAPDARLTERELGDLIFTPGFSTADAVDEISGRGVGMDVVRSEVASLGGRIETESAQGRGTRFTIHLPLTLAVSQVVLVSAGKARFAVPSSSVEQLLQLKPQALASAYEQRAVEWQGTRVPLFFLGSLVEMPELNPVAQHYSPVLVLRSGHQRIALHCDEVTRNQEVVVKGVGPQASRVRGITGATVLGNGEIVLIVNPVAFAQVAAGEVLDRVVQAPSISTVAEELPPVVMVVDDSVTVRKVTQRLLAREGYQVMLAKDGVDALRQLEDTVPDVMLLDIEMPRMDGFDLARHLRADDRYRDLPIVMISSRTADKHRNHAISLGVDVFLGKPYGEEELLAQVAAFTARRRSAALA
jgi:chemosensory pili system protein ChpA (sensor histidine kinase/response regulator)